MARSQRPPQPPVLNLDELPVKAQLSQHTNRSQKALDTSVVNLDEFPATPQIQTDVGLTLQSSHGASQISTDQPEAEYVLVDRTECTKCGRSFATDRIEKHVQACTAGNRKRKKFNSTQHRVQGTEAAQYQPPRGKRTPNPTAKPVSKWRQQHEEFQKILKA
eukprot:NODE_5976_length_587_cov_10.182609_g5811_i0.p1 GENE.NODE_5976_length_587_cov_10.182609_g5811_i0~~NODE_5976_length_587_cov_10.182609_g5811_i0.p1  ORF type:complete len:181 (-),score=31.46 NODE_5976_length_587_cov_10.182609_g5811_i0:45-530(-)